MTTDEVSTVRRAVVTALVTFGVVLGLTALPTTAPAASAVATASIRAAVGGHGTTIAVTGTGSSPAPLRERIVLASGVSSGVDDVIPEPPLCADPVPRDRGSVYAVTAVFERRASTPPPRIVALPSPSPCPSTSAAASIWVMVDKKHPLRPVTYRPSDLRPVALPGNYPMRAEAAFALERLSAASDAAGRGTLAVASAYRSAAYQGALYAAYASASGHRWADLVSARPGYSEHQTGLAADVVACTPGCGSIDAFGSSATGRWVAANAWRYGFIVRYEAGCTAITGYASEPWHLRYVGVALASDYHSGGFRTLEQYLGYPPAPTY